MPHITYLHKLIASIVTLCVEYQEVLRELFVNRPPIIDGNKHWGSLAPNPFAPFYLPESDPWSCLPEPVPGSRPGEEGAVNIFQKNLRR